ncbi:MAG: carbon storage regulator [Planctomycetaceae bacterium]|nr:carbon storage regulator [Planctomycetaceae bacterium]
MLVLTRREGEKILIGDTITVTIGRRWGDKVRIGIIAPDEVRILRGELEALYQGPRVREKTEPEQREESKPAA